MIARVRIAPKKYWCKGVRHYRPKLFDSLPGVEIDIYTESVALRPKWKHCNGRVWEITAESARKCAEICNYYGEINRTPSFCEHMLEMD